CACPRGAGGTAAGAPTGLLLRFIVQRSDVTRHFQAGQQLSVTRIAAHCCFVRASGLVSGRKARPLLGELVADRVLAIEAIFLLHRDVGIAERDATLLRDPLADLFHIQRWELLSTTGMTRLAPRSSAGGNIMAKLRHPIDC